MKMFFTLEVPDDEAKVAAIADKVSEALRVAVQGLPVTALHVRMASDARYAAMEKAWLS